MEAKLAILIKAIAEGEQEIELNRKQLYESVSGEPEVAFKILDTFSRGTLSNKEIGDFLKANGVEAEDEEIQLVLDYYDDSGNKVLNLKDFSKAITPEINKHVKPPKIEANYNDIELALLGFLVSELDLLKNTILLKKPLLDERLSTVLDFYKFIDPDDKGINHNNLADFIEKQGISLSNQDIIAIFRRADKENQKRITYREFKNYILAESSHDKKLFNSMMSDKKIVTMHSNQFRDDAQKIYSQTYNSTNISPGSTGVGFNTGLRSSGLGFTGGLSSSGAGFTTGLRSSGMNFTTDRNYMSTDNNYLATQSIRADSPFQTSSKLLYTYDQGRDSHSYKNNLDPKEHPFARYDLLKSKADAIVNHAKFKEDSWSNYSRAYPYLFGRLPNYQPPSYYDYYPYNHYTPSTRYYRLFDDYQSNYHCVPYVPPYTYYKTYKDLVHEPYYSSYRYYRSREYYGPYVYQSPYTNSLYPLRFSRHYYPELQPRHNQLYRHEILKDDAHRYSKDYFIPYYRPRFYYRVYPRQPTYYYLSSTGKRFYLGDDYVNYYSKSGDEVVKNVKESPKKAYYDDNMFQYEMNGIREKFYPIKYKTISIPEPQVNLYNGREIKWKYEKLLSK